MNLLVSHWFVIDTTVHRCPQGTPLVKENSWFVWISGNCPQGLNNAVQNLIHVLLGLNVGDQSAYLVIDLPSFSHLISHFFNSVHHCCVIASSELSGNGGITQIG